MPDGNLISDALLAQIGAVVKLALRNERRTSEHSEPASSRTPTRFKTHAVILDEELAGVETFLSEASGSTDLAEPNATICEWDAETKKYKQTEKRLAVASHSAEAHEVDTPGAAIPIDGHYWFFGECSPMENRPNPPWK